MEQSKNDMKKADPAIVTTPEEPERCCYSNGENGPSKCKRWSGCIVGGVVLVVLVVLVIIFVAMSSGNGPSEPEWSVGYSTGVSLITQYAVNAKVRSRLATTEIEMEVANALNCSSVHMVTLQLPLNTRVTSLKTTADDGCTSNGEIQELEEAQDTFEEQVAQGLPGAYVEVEDAFTYSLQVSIPPLGVTKVNLVVEQILKQQLGEVHFEIPLIPNEEVDMVVLDVSVQDVSGNPTAFSIDLFLDDPGSNSNSNTTAMGREEIVSSEAIHLDIPDARQYDLPRVLRGRYDPGVLPQGGLLYADDRCFEHFFVPDSMEGMPRNIYFVVDTSYSMSYDNKFDDTKAALTRLIDTLTPQDTFTIQTFAKEGTEELWGSGPGTFEEKEQAKEFVQSLEASGYYANLNEALLEGLLRAKTKAESDPEDSVTILFLISGSYASGGESSRSKIAKHVYELNKEGKVKMFSMGFQDNADMELLDAIALMNGGVSAPILRGHTVDIAEQIREFFESQFGTILLSDVSVNLGTGNDAVLVFGETQQTFSLLSSGYEVAVRGLLDPNPNPTLEDPMNLELSAITSAATLTGAFQWEAATLIQATNTDPSRSSLCYQSYAHSRVTQLMRLYDASAFIDHSILLELVNLANPNCDLEPKVECIKAEALALALEANLVAKGLTAMVTVQDDTCKKIDEQAEICLDGTTPDGDGRGYYSDGPAGLKTSSGARQVNSGAFSFLLAIAVIVAISIFHW